MNKRIWSSTIAFLITLKSALAFGAESDPLFKIGNKTFTYEEAASKNKADFYEIEKKKFDLIDRIARDSYLESFWVEESKKKGLSVEAAQKSYWEKRAKVTDSEVKEALSKYKSHPQLSKLSPNEQEKQIRDFLEDQKKRELTDSLLSAALKNGTLKILLSAPKEPIYEVPVSDTDYVRYGPAPEDSTPRGCSGSHCPITIIEYSEFQCPFCERVQPAMKQLLTQYKGKVRHIVRDFPLSFHDRARPAAIAAKCAGEQGRFWQMYTVLFENQKALGDTDLAQYAEKVGVDKTKWVKCIKNTGPQETVIDANIASGIKLGVSGTPAYFINGRKLSGAMPYEEFRRVVEDELADKKR